MDNLTSFELARAVTPPRHARGFGLAEAQMSDPTVPWERLAGRRELQQILVSFLECGVTGSVALALSGDAGMGKSVLVEAAISTATSLDYLALAGSGSESEAEIEYATLSHVLSPIHWVIPTLDSAERAVLAGAIGHGPATGASARQVAAATEAALSRVGRCRPILIAVDDAQWADDPSAEVLTMLSRAAKRLRLSVLIAHRTGDPLQVDLSAFDALEIPRLARAAASSLLSDRHPELAPSVHDRVLSEAEGSPLALVELPMGLTGRQRHGQDELPAVLPFKGRLRAVFVNQFLRLDSPIRQLLLLAALDRSGAVPVLARAMGREATELTSSSEMSGAINSGLIIVDRGGENRPRVVFSSPLVRATVVDVSTLEEYQRAHRALAGAYAAHLERRAHHLGEATIQPDGAVADILEDTALAHLRRGEAAQALNVLVRAAELSPLTPERRRRLAQAAYLGVAVVGDVARASALLADARASNEAVGRPLDETVAAAHVALVGDGDADTAHRLLVDALRTSATAQENTPRSLLAALATLFETCLYGGRPEFWPPLHAAVSQLADTIPADLRLLVEVLADPAHATPAVLANLDAAVAQLSRDGRRDPTAVARIARTAASVDRISACEGVVRNLADGTHAEGASSCAVNAAIALSIADFHGGQWSRCATLIDNALVLCRRHGMALYAAPLRCGQALLAAVQGDARATERLAREITAWAAPRGLRTVQHSALHACALSAIGQGDFAEAHRLFDRIAPSGSVQASSPQAALEMSYDVVEAAVRSGHYREAVAHVAALRDLHVADISARLSMIVQGASALVASATQAEALFQAALATPGNQEWPFDRSRIRLAYGEFLRRQRKTLAARAELRLALSDLRVVGAWPWVARAAAELRAAETLTDVAKLGLTSQQHEIAELASTGLTNKQIAQRLQLSPRTVAAHLRQVFPKLGITRRGALHDVMRGTQRLAGPVVQS